MFKHVPYFHQKDAMDCGPTSLMMIAAYHGKRFPQTYLREFCFLSREGVSAEGITEGAERVGFQAMTVKVSYAVPKPDAGCLLNALLPTENNIQSTIKTHFPLLKTKALWHLLNN